MTNNGEGSVSDVIAGRARWCVVHGNSWRVRRSLPSGCVDVDLSDPPYSSGGMTRGDRTKSTDSKYTRTEFQGRRPDFTGDAMDGRAWTRWCVGWMEEARRAASENGRIAAFTDWRQLPSMTDAVQAAGWIWRGIAPWNKGEGSRPNPGGFRSQCEFIVWASAGPLPAPTPGVIILPGCFNETVKQDDKHHQTGKPTRLMRDLVKLCPPGGLIFDGFAGSGTTAKAAILEGRRVIAVERSPEYYRVAVERCRAAAEGRRADVRMSADVDTSSPIAAPSPEWGDLFATLAP
jgi:site-specific DNA-methyltransferase (adenine-specific)